MAEGNNCWPGFSEEELQSIRLNDNNNQSINNINETNKKPIKQGTLKSKMKKRSSVTFQTPTGCKTSVDSVDAEGISEETSCVNNPAVVNHDGKVQIRMNDDGVVLEVTPNNKTGRENEHDGKENSDIKQNSEAALIADGVVDDSRVDEESTLKELERKLKSNDVSNLEKFEMRQKLMEEKNKQRRALLTQAIVNRQKRTQEESEKLLHIQKEMTKLDNLVSSDVAILRNQIEQASIEFSVSQKRYKKAEEEFVQAKIELFKKLDRKEQLTEHLCTIIEQNEQRKGEKLIQLMNELEIEVFHDDIICKLENIVIPPQLHCINDTVYKGPVPKDVHVVKNNPSASADSDKQVLSTTSDDASENVSVTAEDNSSKIVLLDDTASGVSGDNCGAVVSNHVSS